jgi:hypothetical protein
LPLGARQKAAKLGGLFSENIQFRNHAAAPEASRITALTGSAFKALNASTLFMSKHQHRGCSLLNDALATDAPFAKSMSPCGRDCSGIPPQRHKNSRFGLLFEANPI